MERDTRPLKLRTKFMLGSIGVVAAVIALLGGTWSGADSGAIIATVSVIGAITGVTTVMQGRSDEKRG